MYISPTPNYFVTAPKVDRLGYVANIIYEIKLNSLGFKPSEECIELRFFNKESVRQENLFPQVEEFIKIYDPALHK